MPAVIRRLVTRPDRLRRDEAAAFRQDILARLEEPSASVQMVEAGRRLLVELDRQTARSQREEFVMVFPEFSMVSEWLAANSCRKLVALRLWALILGYVDRDTGDVVLSRAEMAELLKVSPKDVSRVTSELVECCALSRRRVPVPGMRGPGAVRYTLNPLVGTHLARKLGEDARRAASPLDLRPRSTERRGRAPALAPVVL